MKKDTFYFPHDANAQNDEKCLEIIAIYGMAGYGLYWAIIERMHETASGKLNGKLLNGLAFSLKIEYSLLLQFYNTAIEIGLFVTDGINYWSERVIKNKEILGEKRRRKSEAGIAGMQSRWGHNNNVISEHNTSITKHNKEKQSKANKIKEACSREQVFEFLRSATNKNISDRQIEKETDEFVKKYANEKITNLRALCNTWANNVTEKLILSAKEEYEEKLLKAL